MQGYSHQPYYSPQQHPFQQQNNYNVNGFGTPSHLMVYTGKVFLQHFSPLMKANGIFPCLPPFSSKL